MPQTVMPVTTSPSSPTPTQLASTSHGVSPVWPSLTGLACLGRRDSRA